jgi:hypothetical protein
MYLFIDTNIYLSFYHFSQDDISELKKLLSMIKANEIQLLVTDQVKNEYFRNRESKIYESLKVIKDSRKKQEFPRFIIDYDEYKKLKDIEKSYNALYKTLMEKVNSDIKDNSLAADKLINELFAAGELIKIEDRHIDLARNRMQIGNPPGKNNSLGDAINWELLIEYSYKSWDDLYFISSDKDYVSNLYEDKMNEFLLKEWNDKVETKLVFYSKISSFFKDKYPTIIFNENIERQICVSNLVQSKNFRETHNAISSLTWYDVFTKNEVIQLFEALRSNSQISKIIDDDDVLKFYGPLYEKYKELLPNDITKIFLELTNMEDNNIGDDIPF